MMRIVYATDGSDRAREGAKLLASLPLSPDDTVTLLAVAPPDHGTPQEMRHALHAARELVRASGARLDIRVRWGDPTEQILQESHTVAADLIVLGDSGLANSARLLLYSVGDEVAREAPCAVLIARPRSTGKIRRITVGLDGSAPAEEAVHFLGSLPLPRECVVHLVAVLPSPEAVTSHPFPAVLAKDIRSMERQERCVTEAQLASCATFLSENGVRQITTEVRFGDPTYELIHLGEGSDLLVCGAHGLSGLERLFLGSVSERVLRSAPCSVLCVRPTGKRPGNARSLPERDGSTEALGTASAKSPD